MMEISLVEQKSNIFAAKSDCTKCHLCSIAKHVGIPYRGSAHPKVVLVGIGPGPDEDAQGKSFVGDAGQLLTEIMSQVDGLTEDMYGFLNVVRCIPADARNSGYRDPSKEEIESCLPYLIDDLVELKPQVIVLLGGIPASAILRINHPVIANLRGQVHTSPIPQLDGIKILVTYHPAASIRAKYSGDNRKFQDYAEKIYKDISLAVKILKKSPLEEAEYHYLDTIAKVEDFYRYLHDAYLRGLIEDCAVDYETGSPHQIEIKGGEEESIPRPADPFNSESFITSTGLCADPKVMASIPGISYDSPFKSDPVAQRTLIKLHQEFMKTIPIVTHNGNYELMWAFTKYSAYPRWIRYDTRYGHLFLNPDLARDPDIRGSREKVGFGDFDLKSLARDHFGIVGYNERVWDEHEKCQSFYYIPQSIQGPYNAADALVTQLEKRYQINILNQQGRLKAYYDLHSEPQRALAMMELSGIHYAEDRVIKVESWIDDRIKEAVDYFRSFPEVQKFEHEKSPRLMAYYLKPEDIEDDCEYLVMRNGNLEKVHGTEIKMFGPPMWGPSYQDSRSDIRYGRYELWKDAPCTNGEPISVSWMNSGAKASYLLFHVIGIPYLGIIDSATGKQAGALTAKGIESLNSDILRALVDSFKESGMVEYAKALGVYIDFKKRLKLKTSYINKLSKMRGEDNLVHFHHNLNGTITGRLSGYVHTIPASSIIKQLFTSRWYDMGGLVINPDFSALEVWINAVLSGDETLLSDLRNPDIDIHTFFASVIGHVDMSQVTEIMRKHYKAYSFGWFYDSQGASIAADSGQSLEQVKADLKYLDERFSGVPAYKRTRYDQIEKLGIVDTPMGRVIPLPGGLLAQRGVRSYREDGSWKIEGLSRYDEQVYNEARRRSVNYPTQSTGSDIGLTTSARLVAYCYGYLFDRWNVDPTQVEQSQYTKEWVEEIKQKFGRPRLNSCQFAFTHDAFAFDVFPGELYELVKIIRYESHDRPTQLFEWLKGIKLRMDFAVGATWGSNCKIKSFDGTRITLSGIKTWMEDIFEQFQKPGWDRNRPEILETKTFIKEVDVESLEVSRPSREHPTKPIEHMSAIIDLKW